MSHLKTRGEGNAMAKLNSISVREIRFLAKEKIQYRKIAKWYGISLRQVHRIVHRENWAWLK